MSDEEWLVSEEEIPAKELAKRLRKQAYEKEKQRQKALRAQLKAQKADKKRQERQKKLEALWSCIKPASDITDCDETPRKRCKSASLDEDV